MGLQLADHLQQLLALPVIAAFAHPRLRTVAARGIGEVEPQDVYLATLGEQLAHLTMEVGDILGLIALLVQLGALGVVAHRVEVVNDELRMVPVDERVVEADAEAPGAERLHHRAKDVFPVGGVRRLVVGERRIPETEAIMVLGGDHEVLHAGIGRGLRPGVRVVEVGVEVAEVGVVDLIRDLLALLDPLVARGEGIDAPMDEQAKAIPDKPARVTRGGSRL